MTSEVNMTCAVQILGQWELKFVARQCICSQSFNYSRLPSSKKDCINFSLALRAILVSFRLFFISKIKIQDKRRMVKIGRYDKSGSKTRVRKNLGWVVRTSLSGPFLLFETIRGVYIEVSYIIKLSSINCTILVTPVLKLFDYTPKLNYSPHIT